MNETREGFPGVDPALAMERLGNLGIDSNVIASTYLRLIRNCLGEGMSQADFNPLWQPLLETFESSDAKIKLSLIDSYASSLQSILDLDHIRQGRDLPLDPSAQYEEARNLVVWQSVFGMVDSYADTLRDEESDQDTRAVITGKRFHSKSIGSEKIVGDLREAILDEEWLDLEPSLAFVGFTGIMSRLYIHAVRSNDSKFIRQMQLDTNNLYKDANIKFATLAAKSENLDGALRAYKEAGGSDLKTILDNLGDEAVATINYMAVSRNLLILTGLLKRLPSFGLKKQRALEQTRQVLIGSRLPENITKFYELSNASIANAGDEQEDYDLEFEPMQLDWEVLPAGDLEKAARDIVGGVLHRSKLPEISLERLKILAEIRAMWGEDRSYYARGKLGRRRIFKTNQKAQPDQYILLVMQDHDQSGNLQYEHVIAESPITRRNALYVYREDVGKQPWKHVMSLDKRAAISLGARAIRHIDGETANNLSMPDKISTLLTATPHEFRRLAFHGSRGFRFLKDIVEK